jgi:hypothetical protein
MPVRYNSLVPTVFKFKGFRFFFFSNDASKPVHIHVESEDKYAKLWLEPVQLSRSAAYSAKELREIRNLIAEKTNVFKRRWDEYFRQ